MKRKHIVFILGSFYPNASANGLSVMKVIEILKTTDKVTVICDKTQSNLNKKESYNGYTIIRTESLELKWRNSINNVLYESTSKAIKVAFTTLLTMIKVYRYIRSILSRNNVKKPVIKEYIKALNSIEEPIDVIVPVCFPFESIVAALEFNQANFNSTKVVPYLFDKFAESDTLHRTKWNKNLKMKRHLKLEEYMIANSEKIVTTNDWKNHLDNHFSGYNSKILYSNLPTLVRGNKTVNLRYEDNKIHLVYTGGLNNIIRSPKYMLKFFSDCFIENPNLRLHMYVRGNCDGIIDKFVIANPQQLINHGSVNVEIAQSAILEANVLVSIGNSDVSQTPSKIYEYIASGKPIIHFYQKGEDPVVQILASYPMACCIQQLEEDYENSISKALKFIDIYKFAPRIEFEEIKKYYFDATPDYTAQIFQSII